MRIVCSLIVLIFFSCKIFAADSLVEKNNIIRLQIDSCKVVYPESIKKTHVKVDSNLVVRYKFENDSITFKDTLPIKKMVYVEHTKNIDKILEYVFPIIMLLLGVAIDRMVLYYSEKERINKEGELWMLEVNNLTYSLENQIKSFRSFISSYCDIADAFDVPSIPKYENLKCEIFQSLQKNDLYAYLKSINSSEAKEEFHKILNIISTTRDTYEQFAKYFNKSMEESSRCIDNFSKYLRDYIQELSLNEKIYRECLNGDFDILWELYRVEIEEKMPNINIFTTQESFVIKSMFILGKYDKRQCVNLLRPLFNIQDNIQALRNEKVYCRQNLIQSIQLFDAVLKNISSLTNINQKS